MTQQIGARPSPGNTAHLDAGEQQLSFGDRLTALPIAGPD